ncbi:FAT1 isoform 8, partial [Pan troglodytes]
STTEALFASVEDYILVRGVSLVHTAKMNPVRMAEHALTVWMAPFVSVIRVLGEKGVRVISTSALETPACTGPSVRTRTAPITATAATSTGDVTARMLRPTTKVVDLDPCLSKNPLEEKPSQPHSARESLSEVQSLSSFQSESCDDNGYHWDTSDWMPSVPLPDIQEFPNYEVIDEQTPLYSADPNAIDTDYYPGGYDIESDFPPPPEDFPAADELPPLPPEFSDQFESIHPPRDMPAAGSLGSSSRNRQRFNLNQYLPNFYPLDMSEPQTKGTGENSTCRESHA